MVSFVQTGQVPFTKKTIYRKILRPVRADHKSKMAAKFQMGGTFSTPIFLLEILDFLSRSFVYFEKFPVGQAKTALPFTF